MGRRRRARRGRLRRLLRLDTIHHRQILAREALVVFAGFVQEHAVAVIALLAAKVGRTILGRPVLRPAEGEHAGLEASWMVDTYLSTLSPFCDPSTAVMQASASSLRAKVT